MKRLLTLIILAVIVSGCAHNKISVIDDTSYKSDIDVWQIAFDKCKDTKVSSVSFTFNNDTVSNLVIDCE